MPGYRISVSKGRAVQLPALVSLVAVSGLAIIVSILLWRIHYDGGFTWNSDPAKQFSWHPLLMSTSIILLGVGSIIYRVTPFWSRKLTKAMHSLVMFLGVGVAVPGVWSVWESHSLAQPPIPHMFSLHSWIGLTTLAMMAAQLILGLSIFLFPCASSRIRGQYRHTHVFFGLAFITMATAASLIGLTEEAIFSLSSDYPHLPGKGILLNLIGIFLSIFTATVLYISTKQSFKPLE